MKVILPKIGCHGNILWEIEKRGSDLSISRKTLLCGEKIAKIGLVDPEVFGLDLKKKEITEGKIYSRSASLPNG